MNNGMRIDCRLLPLAMQEQVAMIIARRIEETEERKKETEEELE